MKFNCLKKKPLVMLSDGSFKGYIKDLEINIETNELEYYIVITSTFRILPLFFKKEICITKDDIMYYGNDVILVKDTINSGNSLVNDIES